MGSTFVSFYEVLIMKQLIVAGYEYLEYESQS